VSNRYVSGGNLTSSLDWSWLGNFGANGGGECSGSLINSQWFLTAAHCKPRVDVKVRLENFGLKNWQGYPSYYNREDVIRVIQHPQYNPIDRQNNVALLKLKRKLTYSDEIIPICLDDGSVNYENAEGFTAGRGNSTKDYKTNERLSEARMPVLSNASCSSKYPDSNPATEVCAEKRVGDCPRVNVGGGPLIVRNPEDDRWYSLGVSSYGYGCLGGGVYARSSAYLDWIKSTIANN